MQLTLTHNNHEARLWIDELPDLRYPVADVVRQSIKVSSEGGIGEPCSAAIEVLIRGVPTRYGLMGARFIPDSATDARNLVVEVAMSPKDAALPERVAPPDDRLRAASPSVRAAVAAVARVVAIKDAQSLGPGVLRFDRSARHVAFERNANVDIWLAGAVARLLPLDRDVVSEEIAQALLWTHGPPYLWR